MNGADLIGRKVRASQPGTFHYFTGTVVGPDPLLDGFVRVQYDARDGRGVMEARVHASRCEAVTVQRQCPICGREVTVVNYGIERGREVGYLGRHWRPGIARTAKCRGSFGGWRR